MTGVQTCALPSIACCRVGGFFFAEQCEYVGPASLVGENFGFEETKPHGPIRTASGEILARALRFPARNIEIAMKEIAADIVKDRRWIFSHWRMASGESQGRCQGHRQGYGGTVRPPTEPLPAVAMAVWAQPSSARIMESCTVARENSTSARKILPKSGISTTWPKDLPGIA